MDYWARKPCSRAYLTNLTCEQASYGRMVDQPYNCTSKNQLGTCALIDPNWKLTEEFGVLVGHTLVDATTPSASVLIINPNAEEVVLPCGSYIGNLVPVLSVSVARSTEYLPETMTAELPEYLEDIVRGSHASLGDTGRQSLRDLLHKYEHVFPAQ